MTPAGAARSPAALEPPRAAPYSLAMTDKIDYDALAERYLDLWEQQFGAAAANPALSEALRAWLAPWRSLGAAAGREAKDAGAATAPPGMAAPAAAASRDRGRDLAAVLDRLDRLEARLAALESGMGESAGREPAKPRAAVRRRAPGRAGKPPPGGA
jgi:hypothetical protein